MNSKQLGEAVVLKSYELLKSSLPTLDRIPKKYKYTYGDRLHGLLADFLEQCIEAQYSPKNQKLPMLRKLNITLTKIRFYFRLGLDMNLYSKGHLEIISQRVDDIGRRIGAWIKAVSE